MDIAQAYVQVMLSTEGITDQLNTALTGAGDEAAESAGKSAGGRFASALGTAAKVGAAGVAMAGTAVAALTKEAVSGFSNYQQLVGGIETLYKGASDKMMTYAEQAYETTGMSANQYMETAIQSSAAMITSLNGDYEKAAEMTNLSMIDMADNVNKMGTTMESVQNAYRGFSRGNFTMLDNLALGFAGTKEGMQNLLDQAEKISGVKYDIESYSDIVQAIHVVQSEMGITGTTAEEAAGTVSGSLSMVKSAWDNLVVGMANGDANLGKLIDNVISSAKGALQNMLPVVTQAVKGIGQFIAEVAPVIIEELPGLIDTVLPEILSASQSLLQSLVQTLPSAALSIIQTLATALSEQLPIVVQTSVQIITEFANGLSQMLPTLIPVAVDTVLTIVDTLIDNVPMLIDAALQLIIGLAEGLIEAIPVIIERLPEIITSIVDALIKAAPKIAEAGVKLLTALVQNLPQIISSIVSAVASIGSAIINTVKGWFSSMVEAGGNLLSGLWQGIQDKAQWVVDKVKGIGETILGAVNWVFGNASPSKKFKQIGSYLMEGLEIGIENAAPLAIQSAEEAAKKVVDISNSAFGGVKTGYSHSEIVQEVGNQRETAMLRGAGSYTVSQAPNSLSGEADVVDILNKYLPKLANSVVVLDSGAVVGQLAEPMDGYLGTKKKQVGREILEVS